MKQHQADLTCWRRGRRAGAAALELALVTPFLFFVIFGIIEFGRAFMVLEILNNAARNGARVGVLEGSATSDIQTAASIALGAGAIQGATTTVLVDGNAADAQTAVPGDTLTVTVSVPVANVTWLPGTYYLAGQSLSSTVILLRE